jgi:two-component system chemotaxis sensor kinase CheA
MDDSFELELKQGFLEEAKELLGRVEALSLQLEKDPSRMDLYAEFARMAHNFKGSGKAVGFDPLSRLGHRLEDYVLAIQKGKLQASAPNLDFLFRCLDHLKAMVDLLAMDLNAAMDPSEVIAQIDQRIAGGPELSLVNTSVVPERTEVQMPESPVHDPVVHQKPVEVFRVPKPKLDSLLELVGEQMILQSFLDQNKQDLDGNRDRILKTITQLGKITAEIQSHALSLTLVQITPLFTKLERATRDAARTCGKQVDVHLLGGETEIDKTLVDGLSDALTHVVRNAVDHGLNETGTVCIEARRSGGQLWIEIRDNGKGMDPSALKSKAISKGLISETEASKLTDADAFQLIFKNGFSTKEAVSEISGRGVGMNVVEETVRGLKGSIEIQSAIGQGTCFRLKLPLSLAIFNGAVVRVRESRFVIPSSEISEISRVNLENRIPLDQNAFGIRIRDELFELVDLRQALFGGLPVEVNDQREIPVLLFRGTRSRAFVVNEILGMQKIVQKPIGDEIKSHGEYAAGTIFGDGVPGIILSLRDLEVAA